MEQYESPKDPIYTSKTAIDETVQNQGHCFEIYA